MNISPPFGGLTLSPLDQCSRNLYFDWLLSFRQDDPLRAIPILQKGLAMLFERLPFLKGRLIIGTPRESIGRVVPFSEPVDIDAFLRVKHHDQPLASVKISDLDSILDENKPEGLGAFESLLADVPLLSKTPVMVFQANVMADGIVLNMRWNHCFMDAMGAGAVFTALGECCRASDHGEGQQPSILSLFEEDGSLREALLQAAYPDFEKETQKYPMAIDDASTEAPTVLPGPSEKLHAYTLQFPDSRIQCLKKLCNEFQSCEALSRNDVFTALLAITIHRTRAISAAPTELVMAVNLRARLRPPQFESYLGNLVTIVQAPVPGQAPNAASRCRENGIGHDDMEQIARVGSQIREALESIDDSYISSWIRLDPADMKRITSDHIIFTSWRDLQVHQVDFGPNLGHIEAFECLTPLPNSACVLLPQRMVKDPIWEVKITLDLNQLKTLQQDPLFLWATGV